MKGRPPTPTRLKLVRGNPGKRAVNKREPKPARQIPSPPGHLSKRALVAWGAFSTKLDRLGLLTELDSLALERLCEVYAEIVDLEDQLRGGRTQVTTSRGGHQMERQRPQVAMLQDADRRFKAWLSEFGMTPAARSRVQAAEGEDGEKDPAEAFFA